VTGPAFVTGGAGFAGRHLLALLPAAVAPSRDELELLDARAVRAAIREAAPAVVFHLAALASVGRSWEAPGETLPVEENAALRPQNPYAVSKAACDLLAGQYADAFGLRVVRMRPFNHAGPGQSDDYVVGTLTRQVAEAEAAGRDEAVIRTGNPDSARDFTDVRDVVRAYVAAASLDAGAYNVASGRAVSVRELVELVRGASRLPVRHEVDQARVRAHDLAEVRGSAERLRAATGWRPEIPLERTVADALDAWRTRLGP
jgi:GDP-4-dehydro-6-deoxy-D-mannose reductase